MRLMAKDVIYPDLQDKNDDPILGPDEKCVYWYGDVTKDDLQATGLGSAVMSVIAVA